ncbi:TetR/AcrR family transcriptional regulator [Humibacter albus]|uniref:TetR/AcrR family transcriptional regulator n=1 Tax=Humibacter albus TaxID=427754 RepID=UPI000A04C072|nr:TetR/AcrR family transcriptional regulator [Humibacter albus]
MANESSSGGGAVASDSAAPKPQERVAASVRREQILAAASRVFGERGYYGATTDLVAKAAGISQPYVVRMFGTKENLFVEVLDRALGKLLVAFHAALDEAASKQETHDEMKTRLGAAYADLIGDRGILLSLMQAFITGHEPVIGERARSGFLEIYQLLRDKADMDPDEVVEFLAHGMLFNTLIAMRLVDQLDADDPCVPELLEHTFRTKLDIVVNTVTKNDTTSAADARKTA